MAQEASGASGRRCETARSGREDVFEEVAELRRALTRSPIWRPSWTLSSMSLATIDLRGGGEGLRGSTGGPIRIRRRP